MMDQSNMLLPSSWSSSPSSPWALALTVNNETLPMKIMICLSINALTMFVFSLPFTWLSESKTVFWLATSIFSLANGPLIGYTLDWLNRTTYATEFSTGIAMTGLNLGPSVMILIALLGWYVLGLGVWSVIYVAGSLPLLVIPLVWHSRYFSYRVEVNPTLFMGGKDRYQYMPISSSSGKEQTKATGVHRSRSNSYHSSMPI
jgi:hypothetical protein